MANPSLAGVASVSHSTVLHRVGPRARARAFVFAGVLCWALAWAVVAAGQTSTQWTGFQHDAQHTGRSPYDGPQQDAVDWRVGLGTYTNSPPVVGPTGLIYLATSPTDSQWRITALNPNGTVSFQTAVYNFASSGGLTAPAVADDGTFYFAPTSGDNRRSDLYAFNADGSLRWSQQLGSRVWDGVTLGPEGLLYVAEGFWQSCPESLVAFNRSDGSVRWRTDYDCPFVRVLHAPAVAPAGDIIVSDFTGNGTFLNSHRASDGAAQWSLGLGGSTVSPPVVGGDGTIYVSVDGGVLLAVSSSGQIVWASAYLGAGGYSELSVPVIASDGSIRQVVGVPYVNGIPDPDTPSRLYSFSPAGQQLWVTDLGSGDIRYSSKPHAAVDAQGTTYVSFDSGGCPCGGEAPIPLIYAVANDGTITWAHSTIATGPFALGAGSLYVSAFDSSSWEVIALGDHAQALNATASASPLSGSAPLPVNFTGSATGGTPPYTFDWDFDDGSPHDTTQNPSHTYTAAGTYQVTLTVTDAVSTTATAHVTIGVTPVLPQPCSLTCTATAPDSTTLGTAVSFSASAVPSGSCTGAPTYDWDFGDSSAHSSDSDPEHVYEIAGEPLTGSAETTYIWSFRATVAGQAECRETGSITAKVPPLILVHGWCGDPSADTWGRFPELLETRGFDVFLANLSETPCDWMSQSGKQWCIEPREACVGCNGEGIATLEAVLARQVKKVAREHGGKVDVLAHSMGGLVTRAFISELTTPGPVYRGEIHRLLMVGTPNYGTGGADSVIRHFLCSPTQAQDMQMGSHLLWTLHRAWEAAPSKPHVFTLAGTPGFKGLTDGLVTVYSAALRDQAVPVRYVPYWHAPRIGLPALVNVPDETHGTLRLTDQFLKTGQAPEGCCGDVPLRESILSTGMLVLQIPDAQLRVGALSFDPKADWIKAHIHESQSTITLVGVKPRSGAGTWSGNVSVRPLGLVFQNVIINPARTTLCSTLDSANCQWPAP